ncbi:hypothetical protein, partial [Rhizobium sp. CF142]|uniref:hypothetical protein n=1 Tax=Rhizobium sp. CF142 TaxID=1144314 RepID=UPI001AEBA81C
RNSDQSQDSASPGGDARAVFVSASAIVAVARLCVLVAREDLPSLFSRLLALNFLTATSRRDRRAGVS